MAELSNRLNRLAPSATLAMSQKSSEMKAQGVDVINLSVGEPDFNTPDHIKEAAKKAIDENFSRYSPVPGYMDLRKAIVAKLKNGFKPDERDYGCGAQMLRHLGVHKMRLLTNNPTKRVGLEAYGLEIVENVPIEVVPNKYNERYLKTKRDRMGHTLHLK